jgi:putative transposase
MPRLCRYFLQYVPQHIVQRGNNRQSVFFQDLDYDFFQACLNDAAIIYGCDIHAFALLPNHIHLLVTPQEADSVPKMMQSIGRRYVQHFNSTYQRSGTLWEGRYRACLVEPGGWLLDCYRYIELGPVRAGAADRPDDYPWSSHRFHVLGEKIGFVTPHACYRTLGSSDVARQNAYRQLCEDGMHDEALCAIRASLTAGRVYGSEDFKDSLEQRLARPVRAGKPGRPRKQPSPMAPGPLLAGE